MFATQKNTRELNQQSGPHARNTQPVIQPTAITTCSRKPSTRHHSTMPSHQQRAPPSMYGENEHAKRKTRIEPKRNKPKPVDAEDPNDQERTEEIPSKQQKRTTLQHVTAKSVASLYRLQPNKKETDRFCTISLAEDYKRRSDHGLPRLPSPNRVLRHGAVRLVDASLRSLCMCMDRCSRGLISSSFVSAREDNRADANRRGAASDGLLYMTSLLKHVAVRRLRAGLLSVEQAVDPGVRVASGSV